MSKLLITSTLVMAWYLIMFKIFSEVWEVFKYMWFLDESMSMRQLWALQIASGVKEVLGFIAVMLFIFLLVNILVERNKQKQGANA